MNTSVIGKKVNELLKPILEALCKLSEVNDESTDNSEYKRGYDHAIQQAISMIELMITIIEGRRPGDES